MIPARRRFQRFLASGIALACCLGVAASILAQQAAAQREAVERVRRHADIGQTVRLGGHVNYRLGSGCLSVIPTTISVVQAPSHGTLTVRDEVVTSGHPELGMGGKCQGGSGMGRVVYYLRTSSGRDTFRYDSSSDNGVVHFDVTVD
jgi:hypothetical protein